MLEESVPAILASLGSWFTPTVLFVVVNLVIGTIAVTSKVSSSSSNNHHLPDADDHPRVLSRGSSVLARLKSLNLYRYPSTAVPLPSTLDSDDNSPPAPARRVHWTEEGRFESDRDVSRGGRSGKQRFEYETLQIPARRGEPERFQTPRYESRPSPARRVEPERFQTPRESFPARRVESQQFQTVRDESPPVPRRRVEPDRFDLETRHNESRRVEERIHDSPRQIHKETRPIPAQRVENYEFDHPATPPRRLERAEAAVDFEDLTEEESDYFEPETLEDAFRLAQDGHFKRSQSDSRPTAGETPAKLAGKMKKSASSASPFDHFKAAEPARKNEKPPRVEEEGTGEVEEVDARADDFINRFRKQLQIQRLDSIMRYKDMLSRRTGK